MEKIKSGVSYKPKAENSIFQIYCYIAIRGNPERAETFYNELYDFGNSLADFPNTYPVCKQPQFAKRNMRCAIFHKNYIFVYKIVKNSLTIFNVIHCKTNSTLYSC